MKTIKLLTINILLLFLLLTSCKKSIDNKSKPSPERANIIKEKPKTESQKKLNLDNSKFYLLSNNNSKDYYLKKIYFEEDMEVYKFKKKIFIDRTGSAIMEPLEYFIQEVNNDVNKIIKLKVKSKFLDKIKIIQFEYDSLKGTLYQIEDGKIIKAFIDSLKIDSIKSVYILPCEEYPTDKYEIRDCLEEYVKIEELRRVKSNDFNWYPRLDCPKYFENDFCDKLEAIKH